MSMSSLIFFFSSPVLSSLSFFVFGDVVDVVNGVVNGVVIGVVIGAVDDVVDDVVKGVDEGVVNVDDVDVVIGVVIGAVDDTVDDVVDDVVEGVVEGFVDVDDVDVDVVCGVGFDVVDVCGADVDPNPVAIAFPTAIATCSSRSFVMRCALSPQALAFKSRSYRLRDFGFPSVLQASAIS